MNDEELDEEFPPGDGTADTSADVTCPYCGQAMTISVDPGGGGFQQYVEDCEVCCNPWQVTLHFTNGSATVEVVPLSS